MHYLEILTIFESNTQLPKALIDEIFIYIYSDIDHIMWYLIESGRIFSEDSLKNYNFLMLGNILKLYNKCRDNIISNIKKNKTLVLILEQIGIPVYANNCMLKGYKTYNRLQKEQIMIGECSDLKIVYPTKKLMIEIKRLFIIAYIHKIIPIK
jgi:hypothetical protein